MGPRFLVFLLLYLPILAAQDSQSNAAALPDGVRIPVSVIEDLRSTRLEKGDKLRFRVKANLIGPNKQVVVPKDAIAVATVSDLQRLAKSQPSRLCLLFQEITWKGGRIEVRAFVDGPLTLPPNAELKASGWYSPGSDKRHELSTFSMENLGLEARVDSCPAITNRVDNVGLLAGSSLFIKQLASAPAEIKTPAAP